VFMPFLEIKYELDGDDASLGPPIFIFGHTETTDQSAIDPIQILHSRTLLCVGVLVNVRVTDWPVDDNVLLPQCNEHQISEKLNQAS